MGYLIGIIGSILTIAFILEVIGLGLETYEYRKLKEESEGSELKWGDSRSYGIQLRPDVIIMRPGENVRDYIRLDWEGPHTSKPKLRRRYSSNRINSSRSDGLTLTVF